MCYMIVPLTYRVQRWFPIVIEVISMLEPLRIIHPRAFHSTWCSQSNVSRTAPARLIGETNMASWKASRSGMGNGHDSISDIASRYASLSIWYASCKVPWDKANSMASITWEESIGTWIPELPYDSRLFGDSWMHNATMSCRIDVIIWRSVRWTLVNDQSCPDRDASCHRDNLPWKECTTNPAFGYWLIDPFALGKDERHEIDNLELGNGKQPSNKYRMVRPIDYESSCPNLPFPMLQVLIWMLTGR